VARSGGEEALVALVEAIGATVWFEGLRHHAPFPTGHPSYRQSLPADARQVRKALGETDLVLLIGGPFFEDIWFAAIAGDGDGSAKAEPASRCGDRTM
jgi:benzoylformate decarboxylase